MLAFLEGRARRQRNACVRGAHLGRGEPRGPGAGLALDSGEPGAGGGRVYGIGAGGQRVARAGCGEGKPPFRPAPPTEAPPTPPPKVLDCVKQAQPQADREGLRQGAAAPDPQGDQIIRGRVGKVRQHTAREGAAARVRMCIPLGQGSPRLRLLSSSISPALTSPAHSKGLITNAHTAPSAAA